MSFRDVKANYNRVREWKKITMSAYEGYEYFLFFANQCFLLKA